MDSSDDVVFSSEELLVVDSEDVVMTTIDEDGVEEVNDEDVVTAVDEAVADELVDDGEERELEAELLVLDEVATAAGDDEHPATTRTSAVVDDANTALQKLR